jgi:hypothetical protein
MKALRYLRHRLEERSTYLLIGTGIAGAAALDAPWSYIAAAVGVIAALVPDGSVKPDA